MSLTKTRTLHIKMKLNFYKMKKTAVSPYGKLTFLIFLILLTDFSNVFAVQEFSYANSDVKIMNYTIVSEVNQKAARGVVVNEEGTPLEGVSIIVVKTMTSLKTDSRGRFSINTIPDGSSVIFSCKGYKTYTLPPLVVSNSTIRVRMVKDPEYAEKSVIRIRNTDGSEANPLIVIDGQVSECTVDKIDSESIASMNVLKEKSATDKYGEKGRNGVIEITTKKTDTR